MKINFKLSCFTLLLFGVNIFSAALGATVLAPTIQATDIVVSNITATSATISWTNGNGSKRAVFVENPSGTAAAPYHNTTYTASTDWNNKGTRIGTSNYYCVYNGSDNSVTVNNLPPNSDFAVRISEYNGTEGVEQYYRETATGNPVNFSTPAATIVAPTTQATDIVVSNITATSATISWTNGNGSKRAVFVENPSGTAAAPYHNTTYSASSDWSNKGTRIGTSNYYCVYNGSGNSVTVTNLPPNSDFAVRISEYNGTEGFEQYYRETATGNPINFSTPAATVLAPTIQATDIVVSNITATSATISWTNGNGSKRAVFVENPSGTAAAPYHNTTYTASTDWNNKGTRIGTSNYYCVYNGSGNSVSVTNLPPNSDFAVRISEYNGTEGVEQYYRETATGNPTNFSTPDGNTSVNEDVSNNHVDVTVTPNPTSGVIKVICSQDFQEGVEITVSDLNGKVIFNCVTSQKSTEIDLTNKYSGLYIVSVEIGGTVTVFKVIKK